MPGLFWSNDMPTLLTRPTRIESGGNMPMVIDEYVGRVASGHGQLSIAYLRSPGGWIEPGQTPDFDEYTVVLRGVLQVTHKGGILNVRAGQAVVTHRGEWVQYASPDPDGAEYIAVCLPAFSLDAAHRDKG
jgi:mannose-6-phosphate isomerase-like protein (cupin superfamily)